MREEIITVAKVANFSIRAKRGVDRELVGSGWALTDKFLTKCQNGGGDLLRSFMII